MIAEGHRRVVIENVSPEIDGGQFPAKRVIKERCVVSADVFCDGHDSISATLLYKYADEFTWNSVPMNPLVNDRWQGIFTPEKIGIYYYTVEAWVDHFTTWQKDLSKKHAANQSIEAQLMVGAEMIKHAAGNAPVEFDTILNRFAMLLEKTRDSENAVLIAQNQELTSLMHSYLPRQSITRYDRELSLVVDRTKALYSTWYEIFPRSWSPQPDRPGTLKDCIELIPKIAQMNFDVLYLSPIYPIGTTKRRGKNNAPISEPGDPGSPWAIGNEYGGHKSINPELGTTEDFDLLVCQASKHGMDVAMDIAFQCSPDHPYIKEHPQWFRWRPDGSIMHAENPPKTYEDIVPFNFECDDWKALWQELKSVFEFWIERGVSIFRVDNPHTKPFDFWHWVITEIKTKFPEVIFLAEAFTRPKVMYRLAKAGFSQSYTYFTWRNTKRDLIDYLTELTQTPVRDFLRPNFWPNTPDILPEYLQLDSRQAFIIRLVLAATLSSNYGLYGPAYELLINAALPGKEEYNESEKYEIKRWNWNQPGNIKELVTLVNAIRRDNPALHATANLKFVPIDNEYMIAYVKTTDDMTNSVLTIVNLDPYRPQGGTVDLPLERLDIDTNQPYMVFDMLSDEKFLWHGPKNYIAIDPNVMPAHIFRLHRRLRREVDFDYYM